MNGFMQDTGLYWRPLGGNNIDQISGHCYQYTCVRQCQNKIKKSTIVVDLGKFDNHPALGVKNSVAAVPDIRALLEDKSFNFKALFLTHSHPDHLNGIIHYIRAGYKLPTLYGGKYTRLILQDLYQRYDIGKTQQPTFVEIADGEKFKFGDIEIEPVNASHTCFDCFGFIISDGQTTIYHSGDLKTDQSTYFRKPTNLKKLKQYAEKINFVVADFCGIVNDGIAWKEKDVLKKLVEVIRKSRKRKIFLPVYPTHTEMYILAFLAALKLRKNIVFYGNDDFYTYLEIIKKRGIDFEKIAGNRIKIVEGLPNDLAALNNNFVVIGSFNDIGEWFDASPKDSFALITARTYFNPLKGQMNVRNIKFITLKDYPILQGAGHAFLGDWEIIHNILPHAIFIPKHCPCYVAESFRPLAKFLNFEMIKPTPKNNDLFKLCGNQYELISTSPAVWLVAKDDCSFTEVWQKPTSGTGILKRTFSRRKTDENFKIMMCKRRK